MQGSHASVSLSSPGVATLMRHRYGRPPDWPDVQVASTAVSQTLQLIGPHELDGENQSPGPHSSLQTWSSVWTSLPIPLPVLMWRVALFAILLLPSSLALWHHPRLPRLRSFSSSTKTTTACQAPLRQHLFALMTWQFNLGHAGRHDKSPQLDKHTHGSRPGPKSRSHCQPTCINWLGIVLFMIIIQPALATAVTEAATATAAMPVTDARVGLPTHRGSPEAKHMAPTVHKQGGEARCEQQQGREPGDPSDKHSRASTETSNPSSQQQREPAHLVQRQIDDPQRAHTKKPSNPTHTS